jgi:PHD/YefM family antitoxin component YafN of YafNO toxin-antitoxin module
LTEAARSRPSTRKRTSGALRQAEQRPVVITRHDKPAGVLTGFESEDDCFDFRLENNQSFVARVAKARASLRAGKGVPLEDV